MAKKARTSSRSPAQPAQPATAVAGKQAVAALALALAAGLACSSAALWDETSSLHSNVLGAAGPGSLLFWPRGVAAQAQALGLPCCNLAMLFYCVFIAQKVRANLPSARWLESGLATMLTAFGGGTIVPLLLGVPVVWLRANDLFILHVSVAWLLVNVVAPAAPPIVGVLLESHAVRALFQSFRAAVVFALMDMAKGADIPGGVGVLGLLICGTLGGCGGIFMPFSKGLDPVRAGAPPLMESAFTAAATYLATAAVLATELGQAKLITPLGGPESCVGDDAKLAQLAQFLTVVYFIATA